MTVWHFLFFIKSKIIVCFLSVSLVGAIIVLSFLLTFCLCLYCCITLLHLDRPLTPNHISGIKVSMLASSAVDQGFEPRSG